MQVCDFDPKGSLIFVKAQVFGRYDSRSLNLALDTAATLTNVTPDIIDALGYSALDGDAIASVTSAVGKEHGYLLRVRRFEALGFGMIRSREGRILLDRAA